MDFIIELILDIFGFAADEAMESNRVPLKAKLIIIYVSCAIFTLASLVCAIYFGIAKNSILLCILFILLAAVFIGMGIYGVKRQLNRHQK